MRRELEGSRCRTAHQKTQVGEVLKTVPLHRLMRFAASELDQALADPRIVRFDLANYLLAKSVCRRRGWSSGDRDRRPNEGRAVLLQDIQNRADHEPVFAGRQQTVMCDAAAAQGLQYVGDGRLLLGRGSESNKSARAARIRRGRPGRFRSSQPATPGAARRGVGWRTRGGDGKRAGSGDPAANGAQQARSGFFAWHLRTFRRGPVAHQCLKLMVATRAPVLEKRHRTSLPNRACQTPPARRTAAG